jgi:transcriptional regulator with GAF, ATPase, and Fis domain
LLQPTGELEPQHLGLRQGIGSSRPPPPSNSSATWHENERRYLADVMQRAGGKIYGPDGAAALAGLKPTTFRSKLLKHGLR